MGRPPVDLHRGRCSSRVAARPVGGMAARPDGPVVTHCICMKVELAALQSRAEAVAKGCGSKCGLCLPYIEKGLKS